MQLKLEQLSFGYGRGKGRPALSPLDLTIQPGEFVALVGRSGSGKSTLLQLLKGLQRPTSGRLLIEGIDPWAERKPERFDPIGLLFQYPEHQLFGASLFADIAFGPRQVTPPLPPEEVERRVGAAMASVGLDPATYRDRSPYDLSGGERRRAAIAGVLALQPSVLLLDEPTAGLDRRSREQLFALLHQLNQEGVTILLVSHELEEVLIHATRLVLMDHGRVVADGPPLTLLSDVPTLTGIGLEAPDSVALWSKLASAGFRVPDQLWAPDRSAEAILLQIRERARVGGDRP